MDKQLDLLEKLFETSNGVEKAIGGLVTTANNLKYLYTITYNLRDFFKNRGDVRYNCLTEMLHDVEDSLELLAILMYVYNKYHAKYEDNGGYFDVDQSYWDNICGIKSNYVDNDVLARTNIADFASNIATIFAATFNRYNMGDTHNFVKSQYSRIQENLKSFQSKFNDMNNAF